MRPKLDQTPHPMRPAMSPAAWCIHRIRTSPSYRRRGGPDDAQAGLLKACETRISAEDRERLVKLGHADYAPRARAFHAPEDRLTERT